MTLIIIKIPKHANVLLLEDSVMRIGWFHERIENLKVVRSVEEFKAYFGTKPLVDFIFFDHDLGEGGTGYEAAVWLREKFGNTSGRWGLIHSWNRPGAEKMREVLTGLQHIPFGEFDIEES